MPILTIGDAQHLFIHIPKTGGSSIEASLAPFVAMTLKHNGVPEGFPCPPQHLHYAELTSRLDLARFASRFAVIRHPIDRLVSEYKFRTATRNTFLEFDVWAERALRLGRADPYALDNHLRPQAEFIGPDIELFRFEDGLAPVFAAICDRLGVRGAELAWEKRGRKREITISERRHADIADFYAIDFETFGYAPASGFGATIAPDPAPLSLAAVSRAAQSLIAKPDDKRKHRKRPKS